jgi:hypothetical protein
MSASAMRVLANGLRVCSLRCSCQSLSGQGYGSRLIGWQWLCSCRGPGSRGSGVQLGWEEILAE